MLGADGVRPPHRLVEVLAVAATELGGEVVHELRIRLLRHRLELAILADVGSPVRTEMMVATIELPHFMPARSELGDEVTANGPAGPGDEDSQVLLLYGRGGS